MGKEELADTTPKDNSSPHAAVSHECDVSSPIHVHKAFEKTFEREWAAENQGEGLTISPSVLPDLARTARDIMKHLGRRGRDASDSDSDGSEAQSDPKPRAQRHGTREDSKAEIVELNVLTLMSAAILVRTELKLPVRS